jgi:hypothetical protein
MNRSITLMNTDAKILNKIWETKFNRTLKRTIHHYPVGFIPGVQGYDINI